MGAGRLSERILRGDVRSASRLMRRIDDAEPGAIKAYFEKELAEAERFWRQKPESKS